MSTSGYLVYLQSHGSNTTGRIGLLDTGVADLALNANGICVQDRITARLDCVNGNSACQNGGNPSYNPGDVCLQPGLGSSSWNTYITYNGQVETRALPVRASLQSQLDSYRVYIDCQSLDANAAHKSLQRSREGASRRRCCRDAVPKGNPKRPMCCRRCSVCERHCSYCCQRRH